MAKKVICKKSDCFAYKKGFCDCLTRKAMHEGVCSFYKDKEQKRRQEIQLYGYSDIK